MAARNLRLAFAGDVMLGRLVSGFLEVYGPAYVWGDLLPALHAADARFVNLESVIARGGKPWDLWPKAFYFRAPPSAADALGLAKIDFACLANNHVLDFQEEGLFETLDHLDIQGIAHAGAGENLEEARKPAWLMVEGRRVAVFAATDNEPLWAAGPERPGTNVLGISPGEPTLIPLREAISQARSSGAETVIFSLHWGPNMVRRPPARFRRFARKLIDAGADVVHGHSAHVAQGIELYRGRPILYDTGEFIDDYAVDPWLRNDLSFLFTVTISWDHGKLAVPRIELLPVKIDECRASKAPPLDRAFISSVMVHLCNELGTAVREEEGRLIIEGAGGPGGEKVA